GVGEISLVRRRQGQLRPDLARAGPRLARRSGQGLRCVALRALSARAQPVREYTRRARHRRFRGTGRAAARLVGGAAAPSAAPAAGRFRLARLGRRGERLVRDRGGRHGEHDAAPRARPARGAAPRLMALDAAPGLRILMSDSPRILLLRRDNIGDLVCTTPLLAALRAQLPRAWLGALVTTYNADVLAGNPALDEIFVYEKLKHRSGSLLSHLRTRLGQVSRLRQQSLDCVLVPAPAAQALKLARSLKPGQVIASPTRFSPQLHEVERVFELAHSLGLSGKPAALQVFVDSKRQAELQRQLGPGDFVAIHISARRPAQQWPLERYAAL